MITPRKILYSAQATVEGGRAGHGRTIDGRLEVDLDVPTEMGGTGGPGTNPEELFAIGFAACFQSSLLRFATGRNVDVSHSQLHSWVGIGPVPGGGFGLAVTLDLQAPELDPVVAAQLMTSADEACPYSRATRGNIDVQLRVGGEAIERKAS